MRKKFSKIQIRTIGGRSDQNLIKIKKKKKKNTQNEFLSRI